ncbi:MAG: MFS transporter [Candidatus Dormibacterales bacterium]
MTETAAAAGRLLSLRRQLSLSSLWFALNFQSAALLPIVIPAQVLLLVTPGRVATVQQAALIGWLSAISGASALLVPLVGALSDRTRWELGRRRPYIVVGAVVMLAGLAGVIRPAGVGVFLAGLVLVQVGGNVCTAGYQGLIPDRVPPAQRGAASGFMGAMTLLGSAASLGVAALLLGSASGAASVGAGAGAYYLLTGGVIAVGVLVTVVGVPEAAPRSAWEVGVPGRRREAWTGPWRHRAFRWIFLSRALVMLGLGFFMTFVEYYFATVAGVTNFVQATALLALLALLSGVGGALLLGVVSDRIGRIPIVFTATSFMAVAALAFVFAPSGLTLWPLGVLFGLGYGAYVSVDWALAIDSLPRQADVGKDMGVWSLSSNLPAVVAPLAGSAAIAIASRAGSLTLGYRAIFVLAGGSLAAGAFAVLRVGTGPVAASGPASTPGREMSSWAWALLRLGWAGGGRALGVLTVWLWWEAIFAGRRGIRPVRPGGVLRYDLEPHRGPEVRLADGTVVSPGDLLVEIHLDNRVFAQAHVGPGDAWDMLRRVGEDLDAIAARLADPSLADVRAVHGVTLLAPSGRRLGFEVWPVGSSWRWRLTRFFMVGLVALYDSGGWDAARAYARRWPGEIWMSRARALERVGLRGSAVASRAPLGPRLI